MFLPSFRYTPAITESLAEIERLGARIARLNPAEPAWAAARRQARAARAAGAARLDGAVVSPAEAAALLAGQAVALPAAAAQAVRGYAFALEQIAGDWPPGRDEAELPVIAGLHFFVSHDPTHRGPLAGWRRAPTALCDARDGRPLALTPAPGAVRAELQALTGWLGATRHAVAPAIRAAIACRRLLEIQPQEEANGRTACAYAALLLHRAGLLPHELPAIQAALAQDLDAFYAALLADAEAGGEFTGWLEFYLARLREEYRRVYAELQAAPSEPAGDLPRLNPRQRRILELLDAPGASLANQECQQMFNISPVTAARDFRELVDLGLVEMRGQGRSTYYVKLMGQAHPALE